MRKMIPSLLAFADIRDLKEIQSSWMVSEVHVWWLWWCQVLQCALDAVTGVCRRRQGRGQFWICELDKFEQHFRSIGHIWSPFGDSMPVFVWLGLCPRTWTSLILKRWRGCSQIFLVLCHKPGTLTPWQLLGQRHSEMLCMIRNRWVRVMVLNIASAALLCWTSQHPHALPNSARSIWVATVPYIVSTSILKSRSLAQSCICSVVHSECVCCLLICKDRILWPYMFHMLNG